MDFIETHVRRVLRHHATTKQEFDKRRAFSATLTSWDSGSNWVEVSYGSILVPYPFEEEPVDKLDELDVVIGELEVADWSPLQMAVMQLENMPLNEDEVWNISDVEEAVVTFCDFITDYIELVFGERLQTNKWQATYS